MLDKLFHGTKLDEKRLRQLKKITRQISNHDHYEYIIKKKISSGAIDTSVDPNLVICQKILLKFLKSYLLVLKQSKVLFDRIDSGKYVGMKDWFGLISVVDNCYKLWNQALESAEYQPGGIKKIAGKNINFLGNSMVQLRSKLLAAFAGSRK